MSKIKRPISPDVSEPATGLWSNCLLVDGIAYLSGMTARDKSMQAVAGLDEYEQARIIFGKLKGMVEAAGGAMADVVKLTIFVTDISRRELVWKARREFFTGDFPACSLVQVAALADPSINVEIEGVAHIGASRV
ncbi:RidA family protein [Bradyrhizobium manausense]|uniref:RidA family protein n=1 Tax=Bradyrhizobium manausense TaxID=989370 RepID=UPI001BAD9BE9|nr:RidA family protein [Bradyrhizobium manausense]MBR0725512.1 RidA family protein [Bradyrhizobium manausense]